MLTTKGRVVNGQIVLDEPGIALPKRSELIVSFANIGPNLVHYQSRAESDGIARGNRHYPRIHTESRITIVEQDHSSKTHYRLPLLDVSRGGLSFLANRQYLEDSLIYAGITNPENPADLWLELAMEVRGISPYSSGYKVGCRFQNSLDEGIFYDFSRFLGQ
ncbi:MAG: PilZ domain-containing protein [bacterium]|nr:PilZ domain-containing protein [bacterium]